MTTEFATVTEPIQLDGKFQFRESEIETKFAAGMKTELSNEGITTGIIGSPLKQKQVF